MSVFKSSLFFSAGTLISRFSGLARDTVLASVFGAGTMLDAFIVAFRIPNLFREMLAEGALAGAFTKVLQMRWRKILSKLMSFFGGAGNSFHCYLLFYAV